MTKLALKGFCGIRMWPVSANTAAAYTTGTMFAIPSAQNLTKDVQASDFTVYADDGVYDTGTEYQYEDLEVTVAELPLLIESKLAGGTYVEADKTYLFKNTDAAPEYAVGYAAAQAGGQYRMFKHYCIKLLSVKVDHTTKGEKTEISAYKLKFRNTQRVADGAVRFVKDGSDGTYDWLNTIDNLPVEGG
jgi:phi13 family phage major tail protein